MALRRQPERILINSLTSSTVQDLGGGVVFIEGFGEIQTSEVQSCFKKCPTTPVFEQQLVHVIIPSSCECPYEWGLTIICHPDLSYEINQTFDVTRFYGYEDPAGGTPTAEATARNIASFINSDPNTCVTAVQTDNTGTPAPGVGEYILLTAKNTLIATPFNAYIASGTVTLFTQGVTDPLSADILAKLFPIQPGMFGARPDLTNCGSYCMYYFTICHPGCAVDGAQDISAANHKNDYTEEVYFYVRNDLAGFQANWDNKVTALFTCLQASDPCFSLATTPAIGFTEALSGNCGAGTGVSVNTINPAVFTALGLTINTITWKVTGGAIASGQGTNVMTTTASMSAGDTICVDITFLECAQTYHASLIIVCADPTQNGTAQAGAC